MLLIQNGLLYTMESSVPEKGDLLIDKGKIVKIAASINPTESMRVFSAEGLHILPGFIDAHSHIGLAEEKITAQNDPSNENTNPITPAIRAVDGINPMDSAFHNALAVGITGVMVGPGSANVIGGQIAAMKLAGETVEEMTIKSCAAIKMALGENPKKTYGEARKIAPKTRMAIAAIMRKYLADAQNYAEKKAAGEKVCDLEMEALLPLVRGEIPVHFHAHEADDILTAMRIAHEFNLKYSIVHATDADRIIPKFVSEGSIPMVGPSACWSSKHEMMNSSPGTAGRLQKAGTEVAITTDHDVTPLWLLPMFAGLAVREGLDEEAAFRAITINGAKALGVDDRVGSIAVGKDADIVVYTGHPFQYLSKVEAVFVDGKQYKYRPILTERTELL